MHKILTAQELDDTINKITFLSPKNARRKNAFLAVCYSLNNEINLRYFLKSNYNVGPSYVYAISKKPIFANSIFLGHING